MSLNTEFSAQQKRFAPSAEGSDPGPWGNQPSKSHLIWGIVSSVKSNTLIGKPKMSLIVNNLFDLNYKHFGSFIPAWDEISK